MANEPEPKLPSQRAMMRSLAQQFEFDRDKTCQAFADALRCGKVRRGRNARDSSHEVYAVALWGDGERKGWLRKGNRQVA